MASRTCTLLSLIFCCAVGAANAGIIRVELQDYLVHEGVDRLRFFDGKLLTANDLDAEQSYERSTTRHIHPVMGDLSALFRKIGLANIVLLLDEQDIHPGNRSAPGPDQEPTDEDFIILDPDSERWRGRLFLSESGDIEPGIYDDLVGSFEGLVIRPTEIAAPGFAAGLLLMVAWLSFATTRRTLSVRDRRAA